MKLSIRTLNIIFSISLLLLVSVFVYSYLNIQGLRSANLWVLHTNKIIVSLENISSEVKDAESGVRGYALTKDATHIEHLNYSRQFIHNQLHILDSMVTDNPEQLIYLDTLKNILSERFFLLNGLVNLTNNDADDIEIFAHMKRAKFSTDYINLIIEKMKRNEETLLKIRNDRASKLDKTSPITIVLSGILGFIILSISYYFILLDLRQREKITNELKSKNKLLEYAQEITQMGTFEYNIESNTLFWSNEMYNIFEVDKTTIPRIDFIDTLISDDSKAIHESRKQHFEIGKSYSDELKICIPNGKEKFILSNGYVIQEGNSIVVHGAIIDITPLKKGELAAIEQQKLMRLAKEKAESASQFKTSFLSSMSHEIRTPINAILGFSTVLSKQDLTSEQKDLLKNITVSGELLLKLIGNILDISKIEAGKVIIENKSFHLKGFIRSVLSPFQHAAYEKGLEFNLHIDDTISNYLIGDAPRISQVLVNLIGNALKFTKEGNITVEITSVKKDENINWINFSVSDTGIGVQENKHKEIFESFTQANELISVKYGGTGLGLSIVEDLVKLMGGTIKLTSPVIFNEHLKAHGSKFHFTLPLPIGDNITDKNTVDNLIKPFPRTLTILVADDNEMNRKLALYTLESLGCICELVENGLEAIRKVYLNKYDVIFMDMQMPICDGLQATRQLRVKKVNTPIIGLTANVFQEDINNCLNAGMDDHLGKPYSEEDLYHKINKWVFKTERSSEIETYSYSNYEFIEKISKNNSEIYREMLEMFLSQNSQLLSKIKIAIENKDIEALSFQLHQYKSCVRILNIEKQSSIISSLEKKIEENPTPEHLFKEVDQLLEIGKIVSKEIEQKIVNL